MGNGLRLKNALAAEKAEQAGGAADGVAVAADPPQNSRVARVCHLTFTVLSNQSEVLRSLETPTAPKPFVISAQSKKNCKMVDEDNDVEPEEEELQMPSTEGRNQ